MVMLDNTSFIVEWIITGYDEVGEHEGLGSESSLLYLRAKLRYQK